MHLESLNIFCDVVRHQSFSRGGRRELRQSVRGEPGGAPDREAARGAAHRPLQAAVAAHARGAALLQGLPGDRRALPRARGGGAAPAATLGLYRPARIDLLGAPARPEPVRRSDSGRRCRAPGSIWSTCIPTRSTPACSTTSRTSASSRSPTPGRELTAIPWQSQAMVVACPPGHRFARAAAPMEPGGARRRGLRDVRPRAEGAPRDRPLPPPPRRRGARGGGVRQHREHQAGDRGRRRRRPPARAGPAARGPAGDARQGRLGEPPPASRRSSAP